VPVGAAVDPWREDGDRALAEQLSGPAERDRSCASRAPARFPDQLTTKLTATTSGAVTLPIKIRVP